MAVKGAPVRQIIRESRKPNLSVKFFPPLHCDAEGVAVVPQSTEAGASRGWEFVGNKNCNNAGAVGAEG